MLGSLNQELGGPMENETKTQTAKKDVRGTLTGTPAV